MSNYNIISPSHGFNIRLLSEVCPLRLLSFRSEMEAVKEEIDSFLFVTLFKLGLWFPFCLYCVRTRRMYFENYNSFCEKLLNRTQIRSKAKYQVYLKLKRLSGRVLHCTWIKLLRCKKKLTERLLSFENTIINK